MKTFKEFFTLGVSKPSKMNVQKYLDDLGSARRLLSIPDIIKKIEDYFKTIKNLKIDRSAQKVLSFEEFEPEINELYKDYPGKGWLMDGPDIKPKDIIWRSKVHHWDNTVRSDNTRFIITKTGKGKDKFQMWAMSDKSGEVLFHFGDKSTLDAAKEFASIRRWQEKK